MKIGIICPYNMFKGGGVQEYVLGLRDGMTRAGHKAYIITPQPRDYKGPKIPGIIMLGGSTPFKAFHSYAQVSASVDIDKLEQALKAYNFDILHFHEPWVPMLSRQILNRSRAINIGTFHAAMGERRSSRTIERVITPYTRSLLKNLDILTAVSPVATNYVKSLTSRKIYIIPNGIDIDKFTPKKSAKTFLNKKTLLYIGRLEKRKAVSYLLNALQIINQTEEDFTLIVAGEGPLRGALEEHARQLSLDNVRFLGQIEGSEKIRLLQNADIFCSPAVYGESFGIVLLEAMASRCVIVAGANAGYENVLSGRGQISLVNPKDSREFARRLVVLAKDPLLREAWRKWADAEIQQYSYQAIVEKYLKLYDLAYQKRYGQKT